MRILGKSKPGWRRFGNCCNRSPKRVKIKIKVNRTRKTEGANTVRDVERSTRSVRLVDQQEDAINILNKIWEIEITGKIEMSTRSKIEVSMNQEDKRI